MANFKIGQHVKFINCKDEGQTAGAVLGFYDNHNVIVRLLRPNTEGAIAQVIHESVLEVLPTLNQLQLYQQAIDEIKVICDKYGMALLSQTELKIVNPLEDYTQEEDDNQVKCRDNEYYVDAIGTFPP